MPKATTKAATPRKAPLSRPPAPTEDSVYKSGDFALISSDNVSFKVNTHYLLSASSVFRDMLQGSPTLNSQLLEIHLSDSTMEHSSICRSFLDAVCDGKMPPSTSQGLLHARRLWAFASKYDATVVLSMIRLYIGRAAAVETRLNPGSIFKLGANIGDIEVCCAAIRRNRNWQWSGVTDQTEGMSLKTHGITGKSLFDPAAMPFDHWDSIPSEFIWGLTKAYDPKKDWNAQADEFKRVMTVMRGK